MKRTKTIVFILMALMFPASMLWGASVAKQAPTDTLTVALSDLGEETFLPWNGGMGRNSYLFMIYECLAYTDPKTEQMMPGLATKWEMSPDGKTWTFWIRKGVPFHEGWGELNAEDVKYSIERVMDPKSIATAASSLRAMIEKVEVPEPYKVVISLKSPYIGLIDNYLYDGNPSGIIVCKKYVETVGDEKASTHPIGTGPYTLAEEHKKGGPIKLKTIEGVEKHWRVTPEFKTVTFLSIREEATRVVMLKSGEADLAPISYDSIDTIKASGLRIVSIPKSWNPLIRFGGIVTTDPKRYNPANPWVKKEVRQALNYAVDKEAIAKNIFKGEAVSSGADAPVTAWLDIPTYPYDPAKAKQLLAAAGYPNGFPVTLKTFTSSPGAELPIIGEAVAMYWKAIGIDAKIVPTDWGTLRSEIIGAKTSNFLWTHRNGAFVDPGMALDLNFDVNNVFTTYATPESTSRYTKVKAELDLKKRDQLVKEFGLFVRDEAAGIYLVIANEPYGASKKVGKWPTIRIKPQNIDMITHP